MFNMAAERVGRVQVRLHHHHPISNSIEVGGEGYGEGARSTEEGLRKILGDGQMRYRGDIESLLHMEATRRGT